MQKSSQDVVIVNATRTAIGKFNGCGEIKKPMI